MQFQPIEWFRLVKKVLSTKDGFKKKKRLFSLVSSGSLQVRNKYWVQKKLLVQRTFGSEEILGPQKILGPKTFESKEFGQNQVINSWDTSLAAPGALAHRLQRRTACKIQNGR